MVLVSFFRLLASKNNFRKQKRDFKNSFCNCAYKYSSFCLFQEEIFGYFLLFKNLYLKPN